uniref:DUF1740-domain-containing protein n=1 Tax=Haemonchus contortus TaxID=6289 RepID=A0A7I4YLJ0_HAECO|nr:Protein of unknown function DUF1740 domain containing protein [Haemonchus contortus]
MFPAYANSTPVEREEGELDDGNNYSSFETQQKILEIRELKEKKAKEERMRERKKNEAAIRYIYSDDDDEDVEVHQPAPAPHFTPISEEKVDLPISKKKKKSTKSRRKKEKRKRMKHTRATSSSPESRDRSSRKKRTRSSDSSSSSSSSDSDDQSRRRKRRDSPRLNIKKGKWEFLADREERSNEGSYIVFHSSYDHEIFQMDSIPKGHTAEYRNQFCSILNGNERLVELFFSKEIRDLREKRVRSERYYGGQLRKLNDSNVERIFRKKEPLYHTNIDYIALSKTPDREFRHLHEIAERKRVGEQQQALELQVELTTPPKLVDLELQRQRVAAEFSKDSRNSALLDQFLKINEEIFESSSPGGSAENRKALVDRQLAIIDQAISCHPRKIEFRLKRLEFLKEVKPSREVLSEWEKILNAFVNSCSMWEKYLDFVQYDMAFYSSELLEKAFDRCSAKLHDILNGVFRSHKPEDNTEVFLLHTYVRRLMWWMERGFTNRAVASVQASVEYNLRVPPSLVDASEERKLKAFEEFWNSGVPRFGDQESEGWDHYVATCGSRADLRESELVERELQTQLISSLEERISSSSDDAVISWIEMERELDRIESRPRRRLVANVSTEEGPPPFTEIEFSDLRILRIKCFGPDAILVLLRTLGVHFCGSLGSRTFENSAKVLPCIPTFRLLDEWDLLPPSKKLFPVPSVGANDLALKMVYTMTKIGHSPEFVFSLLETKATQLDQLYRDKPGNVRKAKFEECLREVMSEMNGINFGIPSDDFNLAAVVYALSILRRWVQKEEVTLNCDVSLEEGAQKKRKLKKRELPFTRRQLIDKLSECLFKYSGTPLHLLGNRRLQMLLKLLLLLVQTLFDRGVLKKYTAETDVAALESVARFLLRRNADAKISNTDILAALDEFRQLFRTLDSNLKPLSCFESPRAVCIALQIYFEYGRASKNSGQWLDDCDHLFKYIEHCQSSDDRNAIVRAYMDVLEYNWHSFHSYKTKLFEIMEKGLRICPYDSSIIRRFIDISSSGELQMWKVRRFLTNTQVKSNPTLDMYHSLSYLYMEKRKAERLLEAGVPLHTNVVAEITRREASRRKDPALWRLAMAYSKTKQFFEETHVMASSQCGWSRHLHIDYTAGSMTRKTCEEMIRLMEERGAHVFNNLDYVDLLKAP